MESSLIFQTAFFIFKTPEKKSMSQELQDNIAIVTGGARGIGAAAVRWLAKEGAVVYFTYHTSEREARQLEADLLDQSLRVQALFCDVVDTENIRHICEQVGKENSRIDILVNNAAVNKQALVMRMPDSEWEASLQTNLTAPFQFTKFTLPYMLRNGGSIINISSLAGVIGNPGQCAYAAAKAGLIGFSKSVAKEYAGKNIRCNVIAPGFIDTAMTADMPDAHRQQAMERIPLRRFGQPDEVAAVIAFLAGSQASYITGQVLSVCGGLDM
jgi:3-oxoacyl-[acyl-carrier protein] reductase